MKWFLAGLGIGVTMGVVLAPARGEENRRRLRDTAVRAWDEASEGARGAIDNVRSSEWGQQAIDMANQARERVSNLSNEVRQRVPDVVSNIRERAPEVISNLRERAPEVVSNLRERAPEPVKQVVDRVASAAGVEQSQSAEQGNDDAQSFPSRDSLLDLLNDASQDELISVSGIGPVLALKIVKNRPYKSEEQPLEDNVIPPSAFESLRNHIKKAA
jgi:DNA uptake protein ComE-like DNA-binding protein